MMAVHEFGHVIGALTSGGVVERVVLYPLTISRTDVSPNPNPSIVVWLGPILGCVIPVCVWGAVPSGNDSTWLYLVASPWVIKTVSRGPFFSRSKSSLRAVECTRRDAGP